MKEIFIQAVRLMELVLGSVSPVWTGVISFRSNTTVNQLKLVTFYWLVRSDQPASQPASQLKSHDYAALTWKAQSVYLARFSKKTISQWTLDYSYICLLKPRPILPTVSSIRPNSNMLIKSLFYNLRSSCDGNFTADAFTVDHSQYIIMLQQLVTWGKLDSSVWRY